MAVADAAPLAPEAGRVTTTTTLRRNLNLLRELAVTQFKLKYTGSVLGYLWSLLKPAMNFGMLYVIFDRLLHAGRGTNEFPLQLLVGIVLFTFFAETTVTAMNSIVTSGSIIKKAFFPRFIPVVASTLTAGMTFVINLTLVLLIGGLSGHLHFSIASFWLVALVVEFYALTLGLSLFLSALFTFYRDLGHIWEVMTQLLLYASGVVFPLTIINNPHTRELVSMNPLVQIIEDARRAVVTPSIPWNGETLGALTWVPYVLVVVAVVVGALVFRACRSRFAEYL